MMGIADMFVGINYFAVLVSGVVAMALGALWYGPIFGKQWIALMRFTQTDMATAQAKGMTKSYVLTFVGTLVLSFVLANLAGALQKETFVDGFGLGFWLWLGLIAPVTLGMVLWGGKPWKLWVIDSGHDLVRTLLVAIIVTLWR